MISSTGLDIGPDMANGLGLLLNIPATTAGFLLGGVLVFFVMLIAVILTSKLDAEGPVAGVATLMFGAFGIIVAFLMTWWPSFTIIVAVMFAAIAIVGPLAARD